jgi:hypothetical protein
VVRYAIRLEINFLGTALVCNGYNQIMLFQSKEAATLVALNQFDKRQKFTVIEYHSSEYLYPN